MNLQFLQNRVFRQTGILSGANFISLGIGFLITLILPKVLGADEYGLFALACSVGSFCGIFFEFGFFVSAARLLVIITDIKKKNEIVAMSLRLFLFLAGLFALLMYMLSFFIDQFLQGAIGYIIASAAIFMGSFFSTFVAQQLFQGLNTIDRLALYTCFSKIIYLLLLSVAWWMDILSAKTVFWAFSIAPLIAFCMVFFSYWRMRLEHREELLRNILRVYREFGVKHYFARIIDASAKYLYGIILGRFCSAADMGLFALCMAIASPANVVSQSLTATKFKDFGDFRSMSRKLVLGHYVASIGLSGGCFVFAYLLFHYYYMIEYPEGLNIFSLCIIAVMLQAIYTLYNGWLAVNGLGKEMFCISCVNAVICVCGYCSLIPIYGIYGAAIIMCGSNFYFMLHTIYCYNKHKNLELGN